MHQNLLADMNALARLLHDNSLESTGTLLAQIRDVALRDFEIEDTRS
jgi:hypothetical protein